MIQAWSALESMAARLACQHATDEQLHVACASTFPEFYEGRPSDHHGRVLGRQYPLSPEDHFALGQCDVIKDITSNLLMHVRGIRNTALRQGERAANSIKEHVAIIKALEARDADLAERLVREHGLGLASHVEKYGDYLD